MTPLRQRMLDCMLQRGFAQRTQGCYIEVIKRMARYYGRDPAELTREEVSAYLLHLVKDRHLSFSTVNQAASACRFLYERVLERNSWSTGLRTSRRCGDRSTRPCAECRARRRQWSWVAGP